MLPLCSGGLGYLHGVWAHRKVKVKRIPRSTKSSARQDSDEEKDDAGVVGSVGEALGDKRLLEIEGSHKLCNESAS